MAFTVPPSSSELVALGRPAKSSVRTGRAWRQDSARDAARAATLHSLSSTDDEDEEEEDVDMGFAERTVLGVLNAEKGHSDLPTDPPTREAPKTATEALLTPARALAADESLAAENEALDQLLYSSPMASMEATNQASLQVVATMLERALVTPDELPVVPKSHDDMYLREPDVSVGERPCSRGDACICRTMALMRYGAATDLAFICTEFLLPEERETFLRNGELPTRRQKCLVCTRYFQHYAYILARTDPDFDPTNLSPVLHTFVNSVGVVDSKDSAQMSKHEEEDPVVSTLRRPFRNASATRCRDGYRADAMLFVDEEFFNTSPSARQSPMSALPWRSIVRFCATHYCYQRGSNGRPCITQSRIGVDANHRTELEKAMSFGQPPGEGVDSPVA
jgi:hypothetical protein